MLIPYASDAPLYHRPLGTIAIIIINIVTFMLMCLSENFTEFVILEYGHQLTPVQWITSNFAHGGLTHLLGNMAFLWCFGLIVEGKSGTWKFLAIYFTIGILSCLTEQLVFWNSEGGSLGASTVIFGLMAICLLWAPMNEISMVFLFIVRVFHFEISILWISAFYVGSSFLMLIFNANPHSSEFLHLLGVIYGLPIGYLFLKFSLVDCEGWDLFSLRKKRTSLEHVHFSESTTEALKRREKERAKATKPRSKPYSGEIPTAPKLTASEKFRTLIQEGKFIAAHRQLEKIQIRRPEFRPDFKQCLSMARGLRKLQDWTASTKMYEEAVELDPLDHQIRIELAEIYTMVQQRPSAAARVLKPISRQTVNKVLRPRLEKLEDQIDILLRSGVLEVDYRKDS